MSFKNLMSDLLSLFVLKANFNSLFDSRLNSKKEFIATQAAIGPTVSTVQITATGQTVVSPCSGYAYLRFGGLASASKSFLNVETEYVTHQHDLPYIGHVNSMQVPVQKGENITVNYNGFSNPTTHWIKFQKFVGGGLNSIIQALGGGLWLRLNRFLSRFSLYTRERLNYRLSYPTTFLKQIPSGSGISHSLKQRKLNTQSRAATQLLRHLMGQRVYLWTVRQIPQLKTQEFRQEISSQRHTAQTTSVCDTSAFGFRLSKVRRLGLVLTEVPRRHYGAIQQSARLSFAQGGAL